MARTAKSGRAANLPPKPSDSGFVEWFFQPVMLFRFSLVAGVCALWPYAVQRLPSLTKRSEYQLKFEQIRISPAPNGPVPANLVEQVKKNTANANDLSVLDANLVSDVAEAFRKHPWVSNVVRVKKMFPAAVTVELEYRSPVAFVQLQESRVPIDVHGVILPTGDISKEEIARLPVIQNVSSKPPATPGSVWNDATLLEAVRLADALRDRWIALKLEAIAIGSNSVATASKADVQFELLATGGSKILWGRGVGSDYPGELGSNQKIRRLENYLAEFKDYRQPNGPYEIDIRHWRENTRRPLISDQAHSKPVKNQKADSRIQSSEGKRKSRG